MARFCATFDEDAFDRLVSCHYAAASALARCLLEDASSAEDAVQEAFVRVVRRRATYDPALPFTPWFHTILRNVCRDLRRKRGRQTRGLRELAATTPRPGGVHRPGEWLDLLHALTAEDREVLVLRLVRGLSFGEVADSLGCSVEAAKKRGQRALSRLREARRLAEDGAAGGEPVADRTPLRSASHRPPRPASLTPAEAPV